MIRFIRYLIFTLVFILIIGYLIAYLLADHIIEKAEKVLTREFIAPYGPDEDDQYSYSVQLHIFPLTAEITGLSIKGDALKVDEDVFEDCELGVDRIVCELIPLLEDGEVKIRSAEDMHFSGLLTCERLARRLERTGKALSNLVVDKYGQKARIRGKVGEVKAFDITVLGTWAIDDRGVITLTNREYHNPDSPVPEGAIKILEEQVSFDVRIHLLDEELKPEKVSFDSHGLWLSAHD